MIRASPQRHVPRTHRRRGADAQLKGQCKGQRAKRHEERGKSEIGDVGEGSHCDRQDGAAPLPQRAISAFTRAFDALWRVVGRGGGHSVQTIRPPPPATFGGRPSPPRAIARGRRA